MSSNAHFKPPRGRRRRNDDYVSCWSESEVLDEKKVEAFVVILRTRGCAWSHEQGCLMCGYDKDTSSDVTTEDLMAQWEKAQSSRGEATVLKVFTSGSFLDKNEVPMEVQKRILTDASSWAKLAIVEARPQFVEKGHIDQLVHILPLEVAMGLESSSDLVRSKCVNKGFTFSDFKEAASILKGCGARVKTYLLLKPPFLTEKEAIEDATRSIVEAGEFSDTVSLNPVNIQKGTMVERMHRGGEYRSPWLWSVLKVLNSAAPQTGARIVCSPTAGGTNRGAHNCRVCDTEILESLAKFNISADLAVLGTPGCKCKLVWDRTVEIERFIGATV